MTNGCHSKERRRLIEIVDSVMRRAPLSTAQRNRLGQALRELKREQNWRTDAGHRRIFHAVGVIASIPLELVRGEYVKG